MKKLILFTYLVELLIFSCSINAQVVWEKLKNPAFPESALISDFKIVKNNFWLTATLDYGLFSSSDHGETWNRIFFQDDYVSSIDVNYQNEIFIDCFYQFYKSTDEGINWSIIPHDSIIGSPEILQLSYDDNLYAIFDALEIHYIAKLDSLDQWHVVGDFSPGLSHYVSVTELLIDKFDDIYLSADHSSVPFYYRYTYKGLNGFNNFHLIFNDISKLACNDSGYTFVGNIWDSKLYRSSDRGLTFQEINNGIPNLGIYSIKVLNGSELYVGNLSDLYYSVNNGNSWYYFNGPDSILGIFSIEEISPGYLAIASEQSIYLNTSILDVENQSYNADKLKDFYLSQNYPNPFNPSTIIRFVIPNEVRNLKDFSSQAPRSNNSLVTLKVYDVLGNEVTTLVNEEKQPGEYEVEFDAFGLTSGIYFYQLRAGDPSTGSGQSFVQTKKMLMIK